MNWTTEQLEAHEQRQLARRLDAAAKYVDYPPKFTRKETPAGTEINMVIHTAKPKTAKTKTAKPARILIGTTFVGVDPALRAGGFWLCIICRVDNTATFKSCKHLGEFVRILQDATPAAVKVENSNLQKAIFDKKVKSDARQKGAVGIAISVGKNMGISQAAADIADQYSEIPTGISPKKKGAKVTSDTVFQGIVRANGLTLTGYKGAIKAAQDQRDALMLALIAEQQYKLFLKR